MSHIWYVNIQARFITYTAISMHIHWKVLHFFHLTLLFFLFFSFLGEVLDVIFFLVWSTFTSFWTSYCKICTIWSNLNKFISLATLLHILICWLLVLKFSLGCRGAATAISISYWFNALMLALYVKLSPLHHRGSIGSSEIS